MNHTHIRRQRKNIEQRHKKDLKNRKNKKAIRFIQDFNNLLIDYDNEMRTNNK